MPADRLDHSRAVSRATSLEPWPVQHSTMAERDGQLRWLLLLRVAVATAVLAAVLYTQFMAGSEISLGPLFAVLAATYGASLAFALAHRWGVHWDPFAGLQLALDVVLETLLICFTGGLRSAFVVLYLLTVMAGGVMLTRHGAFLLASFSGVCYGLMGLAIYYRLLPEGAFWAGFVGAVAGPSELYLRLFSLLLVAYGVAWLTGAVAARLRQAAQQLRARQSQLRALERLNQAIIQGMSSGLIVADRAGRTLTFNRAAEEILGRSPGELLYHPVWEIFGAEPGWLQRLAQRLERQRIYGTERRVRAPQGGRRILALSVSGLEQARTGSGQAGGGAQAGRGGRAGGYIFMFQDVTEVRRMERELRIRDRMAVLGEMAGSIAHEIRNPLASISGSLQVLRGGSLPSDSPQAAELMDIVIRESERLSRTIAQFLEYARPGPFEPRETDLLQLVQETLVLLRNSTELRPEHRVKVNAAPGEYSALVDPSQMKQVFWNLARNGIQAMPGGGTLRVGVARTRRGIEVSFEDTGVGMSAEEIERFFQPYVSGSAQGTGLGLAVVYRVLERHGVRVEVDSEPGQGTRVVLTFPERAADDEGQQLPLRGVGKAAVRVPGDRP